MQVPKRFVGLHSHSMFSQGDGLDYPQDHIDFCIKNGLDAWTMTDHGNMNGFGHAWSHSEKLRKAGGNFKFIPGCEMYLHPDLNEWRIDVQTAREAAEQRKIDKQALKDSKKKRTDGGIVTPLIATVDGDDEAVDLGIDEGAALTVENEEETKSTKFYNPVNRRHHLVVLPRTSKGLESIFGLVSKSYKDGFYRFPRIDYKMLKEAAGNGDILLSTACLSPDSEVITDIGTIRIDDLVSKVKQGMDINILSYNELSSKPEFKPVTWGDITRKNAKTLIVKLKNGKKVRLTSDHKVYTDKGWIEAGELNKHQGIKILSL